MKKREVLFLIVLVVLDQLTKYIASVCLTAGKPVEVIRNFFYLTLVHNTGAAWSILEGQMWFFYILTAVMLAVFFMYLMKTDKKDLLLRYALLTVIAGTIGNFIDRVLFQQVTDFLDFYPFGYNFPVFNVADMELCIGAGLLVIYVFFHKETKEGV
ncbi:MAG: signal peptidase II [Erysipelotrichales bacterium]|nr:signal peptidase II [Erysipelotrichales bacterium]MBQ2310633.1 signal peptidase II [Erysipelotrichales bacterium]MBQ2478798.1 signal peptidase II [Erysipelotrichales bacterium]MBQ4375272.1 signal peptidase II [Erysipelotrichales bacterium]